MNRAQFFDSAGQGLDALIARTEKFRNLPANLMNHKTTAHDWTLGQMFDHLVKSDIVIGERFYKALESTPKAEEDDIRHTFVGRMIINAMTKPNVPVPKGFEPGSETFDSSGVQRYLDNLLLHRSRLDDTMRYELAKLKLKSPVTNLLSYNGYDLLALCVAHGARHLAQAEAVRRLLEPVPA